MAGSVHSVGIAGLESSASPASTQPNCLFQRREGLTCQSRLPNDAPAKVTEALLGLGSGQPAARERAVLFLLRLPALEQDVWPGLFEPAPGLVRGLAALAPRKKNGEPCSCGDVHFDYHTSPASISSCRFFDGDMKSPGRGSVWLELVFCACG